MAKRPNLTDITVDRLTAVANYNSNNANILAAFDNTLSLDGSSPNQMGADFDMNSNKILNAGSVSTAVLMLAGQRVVPDTTLVPDPDDLDLYYEDVTSDIYGAVGDGVADDTVAIQSALNTGNSVFLPAGTYKITSLLTMAASGQVIFGEGFRSYIRQDSTDNANTSCLQITGNSSIVRDLRFKNNDAWTNFITGYCVDINTANRSLVARCFFDDHSKGVIIRGSNYVRVTQCNFNTDYFDPATMDSSQGGSDVLVTYGSSYCMVDHNFMDGNSTGISVQQIVGEGGMEHNIIANNEIHNQGTYGIIVYRQELEPTGVLRRTIVHSNNVSEIDGGTESSGAGTNPFGAGIYLQGSQEGICMGNYVRRTNLNTVDEQLAPAGIGCTNGANNLIVGNWVEDTAWYGICAFNSGQQGDTTNDWTQIHDNHVMNSTKASIYGKSIERISIKSNVLTNSTAQGVLIQDNGAVFNHVHSVVTDNVIAGAGGTAVSVDNGDSCLINDNHITDPASAGIVANTDHAVVTNNYVQNSQASRAIQISSGVTSGVCRGNHILDSVVGINASGVCQGYEDNLITNCTTDYQGTYQPWRDLTANDTTPSVAGGRTFTTANTSPTSITDFDDEPGHAYEMTIFINDTNTTFVQGQLKLKGNTNWVTPPVGSSITFVFYPTGSVWVEKSRMQLS